MSELPQVTQTLYASALSASGLAIAPQVAVDWPNQALKSRGFGIPNKPPLAFYNAQDAKAILALYKEPPVPARLVKVFIVDPDESVPLDKRVLFRGDEKFTDLNDQELFFEIGVGDMLAKHNAYRITLEDKKASKEKAKTVQLDPIRIRDLKMAVVVLASF